MFYLYSVILGIIEGITEFLPISSTGHLILAEKILNLPSTEFWKSFLIFIQLGAILAVIFIYWKKIVSNHTLIWKVSVGFLPTAIIGLALYKIIKQYFLDNALIVLISLFIGGIAIIVIEKWYIKNADKVKTEDLADISYKKAFIIGLCQSLSVIPGVSRAATTIMGGLILKIKRTAIVEFSFLLAIPTMAGATGLDLIKSRFIFTKAETIILFLGFIVSFITALVIIKIFIRFIQKNNFIGFGWYRIALSIIGYVILFII